MLTDELNTKNKKLNDPVTESGNNVDEQLNDEIKQLNILADIIVAYILKEE